jgi:hypothetical protein
MELASASGFAARDWVLELNLLPKPARLLLAPDLAGRPPRSEKNGRFDGTDGESATPSPEVLDEVA